MTIKINKIIKLLLYELFVKNILSYCQIVSI